MLKGIRRAAALGLVVALVSLSAAPAVAAPRVDEAPGASYLDIPDFAYHLADLFADWMRLIFAPSGGAGDPNGAP